MLAVLPLGGLVATTWLFRRLGEAWRASVLASAVCCGLFISFSTEILSVFRLVNTPALALLWMLFDLAIVVCALWFRSQKASPGRSVLARIDYLLIGGIGLIVLLVGVTALLAPPNTWDVVSYHLARVAIWQNNRDVYNYPTFYSAQLFLSPWAEYGILHLYVLAGGDYLANMVEWLSMIGLIIAGSLVAERLGAGTRGQVLAAVSCATIPGLILESSGSMNTGVVAFWMVVAVYYLLRAGEEEDWSSYLAAASAAGLAAFTKGTAYIFLPCIVVACWLIASRGSRRRWLLRLPAAALVFLSINGPLYVRNYDLSGSPFGFATPLGQDEQRQYANSRHSIGIAYANTIKNLALHLGTPVHAVNDRVLKVVRGSIRIMGIDPDDTAATYRNGFWIPPMSTYESTAGAPVQCLIILAGAVLLLSTRYGDRPLRLLLLASAGSFVLFCALIRWQAWNARYQIPLICISLCVASVVLERFNARIVAPAVAGLALLYATPFCVRNSLRPVAPWKNTSLLRRPRVDFYFEDGHPNLEKPYEFATTRIVRGSCRDIGIDSSLEDFEYPLMAMLKSGSKDLRIRYYEVHNLTGRYVRPEDKSPPCAVICLRCANVPAKWAEYRDIGGRVATNDEIAIFSKDGDASNDREFTLPKPFDSEESLKQLDKSRDALGFAIATTSDARSRIDAVAKDVERAGRRWPDKALELDHELSGIATLSYAAWRARDSVDPMLRAGERVDYAKADQIQFAAASELLESWRESVPARFDALEDRIGQLSVGWELRTVVGPKPVNGQDSSCELTIEKAGSRREVQVHPCSCLSGRDTPGSLLAVKPVGKFDTEAQRLTTCSW